MSTQAIETRRLAKYFGPTRAVDGIDLNVPPGSVYGFLGRNGAGKTTTIRMLMGLDRPTSGTVSILGLKWPHDGISILSKTAFVGEKKQLFNSMTGRDLIRFNRPFFPTWSDELAEECIRRLEIPMNQRFGKTSYGTRTKLCLLMAIAQQGELLILDEPTSGLDPFVVDELLSLLMEYCSGEQRTIFIASHDLAEVERISDVVGIIDNGKLLLEARLDDIRGGFRRITASGNALPKTKTPEVISILPSESACEYIVTSKPDHFIDELRAQGAVILDVSALSLSEVFLRVIREEESCTSGNAGVIRV